MQGLLLNFGANPPRLPMPTKSSGLIAKSRWLHLSKRASSSNLDIDSLLALVDESFKSDREFVLAVVQKNASALNDFDEKFKSDPEITLAAVQAAGGLSDSEDLNLKSDREIVLETVKQDGVASIRHRGIQIRSRSFWLPCNKMDGHLNTHPMN